MSDPNAEAIARRARRTQLLIYLLMAIGMLAPVLLAFLTGHIVIEF